MIIKYKKTTTFLILACFIINFTVFAHKTDSSVKSSFGGTIYQTFNCASPLSCMPMSVVFPVCLVVRCILQNPFVLHVFDNYLTTSSNAPDAFDSLLNTILEPMESANCPAMCAPLGIVAPPACAAYCGGLSGLQQNNSSPAGMAVEGMKRAAQQAGMSSPGILMAYQPMIINPICDATAPLPYFPIRQQLLGLGMGAGLYTTQPGTGDVVVDNCGLFGMGNNMYYPSIFGPF